MRTLAQIRAGNALQAAKTPGLGTGQMEGDALSGLPVTILTDGLLAACAFACERKGDSTPKHKGEHLIMNAIAAHLRDLKIAKAADPDALVAELAQAADDSQLRRATAEAIEYLNYLKRFVA